MKKESFVDNPSRYLRTPRTTVEAFRGHEYASPIHRDSHESISNIVKILIVLLVLMGGAFFLGVHS